MPDLECQHGLVESVNVSTSKGTPKQPAPEIQLSDRGVAADAHAGLWHRQVSLLAQERIQAFGAGHGRAIKPGEFAENVTTSGLDLEQVAVLDRIFLGPDVELEVTQIGKACHGDTCAIFREVGACLMPREGIFARVLSDGTVSQGMAIRIQPRPLRVLIVTVSDRASLGEYADRSGPRIEALLRDYFAATRWHLRCSRVLIPDDAEQLEQQLERAAATGVELVFTTGGTGVGPRDVTPEVVTALADKTIPGIMEQIRLRFGSEFPNALLSRAVAAVLSHSLVYTLPGGVRAVEDYVGEILKTTEHLLLMIRGIDAH